MRLAVVLSRSAVTICSVVARAEDDNRCLRPGAQRGNNFVALHIRQVEVQQELTDRSIAPQPLFLQSGNPVAAIEMRRSDHLTRAVDEHSVGWNRKPALDGGANDDLATSH